MNSEADHLNAQLAQLYEREWHRLQAVASGAEGVSNPLLLHVDPRYLAAPVKLMVVGQETCGWFGRWPESIANLQTGYEKFALGARYRPSPFWRFSHALLEHLNPGAHPQTMMWSNLNPMDQHRRRPRDIEVKLAEIGLVRQEVELLKPDVVVFLTGPRYDPLLADHFPEAHQEPIEGLVQRFLCRIRHPSLPCSAFRTYHPAYLMRSKQYTTALQAIIDLSTSHPSSH